MMKSKKEKESVLIQALKASELRYRRLFEAAQDGILILNARTGLIEDVNPYLIKMLGYSREEFVKKKLWEVGAFKDIKASKDAFEVLQEKEYIRYEDLPLKTKQGTLVQVEFISNVYWAGDEKVIQCNIRENAEHKLIIAALQANEKKYHDLLHHSPDGYFIIELSGNILTVNEAMCKELEFSEDEFLSMNIWEIIPDQYLDQYKERLTKTLEGASLKEATEYEVRGKNGGTHYVEVLSAPRYSGGDIIGFQGVARDITARKRAEKALRISEHRFKMASLATKDIIWERNLPANTISWNESMQKLFHYKAGEIEPTVDWWRDHIHPKERAKVMESIQTVLAQGGDFWSKEYRFRLADGSYAHVFDRGYILYDEQGRLAQFIGAMVDVTEQKQSEKALRLSEEKYRTLITHLPTVVYTNSLDDISSTLYVSPQIEHLLGYTPQEWLDDPKLWSSTIHPEDRAEVLRQTSLADQRKKPFEMDYRMTHRDGSLVWVHDQLTLVNDLEGKPQYWQGIMLDITERKHAEAVAREGQQRLSQVWEATSDAMSLSDPDGIVLAANRAYLALYGYKLEEIVGRSFAVIFPQELQAQAVEQYKTVFASEVLPPTFESTIRRADGSERIVEATVDFLTASEQRIAMLSTIRDITERKRAEKALYESEERFRNAFQYSAIGMALVSLEGKWLKVNSMLCSIVGYSEDELLAKTFQDITHPDDLNSDLSLLNQLLAGEIESYTMEKRYFHKEGKIIWAFLAVALARDNMGVPLHFISQIEDITERKHGQEKIQRQLEHLTATSAIDRVIASSFDLKLSFSQILGHVTKELGVDAADILIFDPIMQMLDYGAGRGFRSTAVKKAQVPLGESYAGRVALERKLVQIPNLDNEPNNLLLTSLLAGEDFVCYYGVPLITKGQVKGVLEVFHRTALHPDTEWFDFLHTLAGQAAIAIENFTLFDGLQRTNSELVLAYETTLEGWSRALDLRDKETEGHTQRVTEMAVELARAFGLSEVELLNVRRGGLLHDIGKMGVPDHILLKPGELSSEEWQLMKMHPVYAYDLLSHIAYLKEALDIPYCHHEKWDGSGYPRGLKGTQIPLTARIFAVVDVWDALMSDRPYRPAWPQEKVREHIRTLSGTHFDPQVAELFLQLIGRMPMT